MNTDVQKILNDFFNNIDYSKPLSEHVTQMSFNNFENIVYKLVLIIVGISIVKIISFYAMQKYVFVKPEVKDNLKPISEMSYWEFKRYEKTCEKQGLFDKNTIINTKTQEKINKDTVVECEIKVQDKITADLSQQARSLFNVMLKDKKLKRQDVLAVKDYLKKNVTQIKGKKYNSDAHYIYSTLKNADISKYTIEQVIQFLQSKAC